ncbi:non-homologous end-joining DNA ligase [Micropruina sp.]|uniref:non-homologous end-joining DNA ligase n=1 Tax=Micropruina sp. TaxID=2737536 RepID=UPI0039E4EFF8
MAQPVQPLEVDGRLVKVTNLDKVLYPETGTTKGEVIAYYQAIAPLFVPHARRRPATRKRWPNGVGTPEHPQRPFFHKNLDAKSTPDWVHTFSIEHSEGDNLYPLIDDPATLVWLAQLATLELHVPQWTVRGDRPQPPDRLVLDLDPGEGAGLEQCVEVAHLLREVLDGVGFPSVPVTSGSKGIHLYAALDGSMSSHEASGWARELARSLEAMHPGLVVSDMKRALRTGKVLLDWSQNSSAKTTIAPYSLRGRARPTVACPRRWDELDTGLRQLDFHEVLERIQSTGDVMAALDHRSSDDLAGTASPPLVELVETDGGDGVSTSSTDGGEVSTGPIGGGEHELPMVAPMLATAGTAADVQGDGWVFEIKWDGYRAVASVSGGAVTLTSRRGLDLTKDFPELAELGTVFAGHDAVVDGEVVLLDESGRSSFERLQNRALHRGEAHYLAFDLLHLDGRSLLQQSYTERRRQLAELVGDGTARVQLSIPLGTDADEALAISAELGLEGVVAKRADSIYQPGRRARTWIKIKHILTQQVVIIGWLPGENSRARTIGALLMAVPDGDRLSYVGRVGSGFTDKDLADTKLVLSEIETSGTEVEDVPALERKTAHWVEPVLVGEVSYGVWTQAGRLRMPVWRGWRPDKTVEDITLPDDD